MSKCEFCEKEMLRAKGCMNHAYEIRHEGFVLPEPVNINQVHENGRCVDCAAKLGQPHHIGCDQEECGACGGQAIGCGCNYTDKVELWK